jgi:hypothetical protein
MHRKLNLVIKISLAATSVDGDQTDGRSDRQIVGGAFPTRCSPSGSAMKGHWVDGVERAWDWPFSQKRPIEAIMERRMAPSPNY